MKSTVFPHKCVYLIQKIYKSIYCSLMTNMFELTTDLIGRFIPGCAISPGIPSNPRSPFIPEVPGVPGSPGGPIKPIFNKNTSI